MLRRWRTLPRWAFVLRLLLSLSILLQLVGPPTATASSAAPPSLPTLPVLDLGASAAPFTSWVRNVVRSVTGQQVAVPATANVALSTPWTAFAGGVNAVQGNVSLAQADLAIPSVGFATAVGRAGIDCGADCTEAYPCGTSVVLTAAPASGSRFTGWSGAGTATTCTVSMTAARSVTATFASP